MAPLRWCGRVGAARVTIAPITAHRWLKARNQKEKLILGVVAGIAVRSGAGRGHFWCT